MPIISPILPAAVLPLTFFALTFPCFSRLAFLAPASHRRRLLALYLTGQPSFHLLSHRPRTYPRNTCLHRCSHAIQSLSIWSQRRVWVSSQLRSAQPPAHQYSGLPTNPSLHVYHLHKARARLCPVQPFGFSVPPSCIGRLFPSIPSSSTHVHRIIPCSLNPIRLAVAHDDSISLSPVQCARMNPSP